MYVTNIFPKISICARFFILLGFTDSSVGKESAFNAGGPGSITESGNSAGEGIGYPLQYSWASLVAPLVKNPPAMSETWVWSLVGTIPWRREKLPTPVFWPGEFHGLYSPWVHKELDTTEWLSLTRSLMNLLSQVNWNLNLHSLWLFSEHLLCSRAHGMIVRIVLT